MLFIWRNKLATRRMFAKTIISSAAFVKMPPSSQMLYFHLGLNADDDGIVEAFPIMRMVGASEDDLKILVAKGFMIILNNDSVSFIKDWKEHNLIRQDRKVDSKYRLLLLDVVDDVKLLSNDNQMTTKCQADASECPPRLGKDRLGKDRKDSYAKKVVSYSSSFINLWGSIYKHGDRTGDKEQAQKNYDARIKEGYSEEQLLRAASNYAKYCAAKNQTMITLCSNFYGRKGEFKEWIDYDATKLQQIKQDNQPKQNQYQPKSPLDIYGFDYGA